MFGKEGYTIPLKEQKSESKLYPFLFRIFIFIK